MSRKAMPSRKETAQDLCYESRDWFSGDVFRICRSETSGILYTNPVPADINSYYPQDYREFRPLVSRFVRLQYGRKATAITRRMGCGRVLEVGCGAGWMLQAFKARGWEAFGFERTPEIASAVSRATGLTVHSGSLSTIPDVTKFDLVVLYNVLEHLPNPDEVLAQCRRLLSPTGLISITVPNIASWQAMLTRGKWFHLDVPRHLFHFSPESLRRLLINHGFAVRSAANVSVALDAFGWIQSLENLMFQEPNRLYKFLSRSKSGAKESWFSPAILLGLAALLSPLALLILPFSWVVNRGAILEIAASPNAPS